MITFAMALMLETPTITIPVERDLASLNTQQAAIIYDQCLARIAGKASRTDMPAEKIYDVAKSGCASTRQMLVADLPPEAEKVKVLNDIDSERAASFPERITKFREMMREYQPKTEAAK